MSKIISVSNQKGGVGKTTTAVNLSAALALLGKKVLLVDMDPQGNASMSVGINKMLQEKTVYQLLLGTATFAEVRQKTDLANLDVLPANKHLAAALVELVNAESREKILMGALRANIEEYDFIFIDCPPALSLLTINSLIASDSVLIPMQCEYFSLEGLADLLDTIQRIKNNSNPRLSILGLLRVMYDKRSSLSVQVSKELEKHFPQKLLKTVIPRNVRLAEAPSFGKPVVVLDIKAQGAQAYINLAQEFLQQIAK